MDPDEALRQIRHLVSLDHPDMDRLRDLFEGLDTWLMRGGFLPAAWERRS